MISIHMPCIYLYTQSICVTRATCMFANIYTNMILLYTYIHVCICICIRLRMCVF